MTVNVVLCMFMIDGVCMATDCCLLVNDVFTIATGSLLGAEQGISCVPTDWRLRTPLFAKVEAYTKVVVGSNGHFDRHTEIGCKVPSYK